MHRIESWLLCYWVGYRAAGTPRVKKNNIEIRELYNGGFLKD
jgi:hypothetical protein